MPRNVKARRRRGCIIWRGGSRANVEEHFDVFPHSASCLSHPSHFFHRRAIVTVQQNRLMVNQERLRLDRVRADEGNLAQRCSPTTSGAILAILSCALSEN